MKINFGHYVGKYAPWYIILLCRDRSAAAWRCACFFLVISFVVVFVVVVVVVVNI